MTQPRSARPGASLLVRMFSPLAALVAAILVLALPEQAMAWGPGAHMVTANWLLANAGSLPAGIAAAIAQFPSLFYLGCLSPDIFIGKGCVAKKGHSHNWDSGFTLLGRADTSEKRAYAYGYLSHLAADTVAHGVYVPFTMGSLPLSGKLSHVYLESQADRVLAWNPREALDSFRQPGSSSASRMLREALDKNPLFFSLQSRVFRSSIALGGSRVWDRTMMAAGRILPSAAPELIGDMVNASGLAARDVLCRMEGSPVLTLDPIGEHALAAACAFPGAGTDRPRLPEALLSLPGMTSTQAAA